MDLWEAVMVPAMSGQSQRVQQTLRRLPAPLTPRQDAIAARALLTIGDSEAAAPHLDRALRAGDLEAEALTRLILPDGAALAERHLLLLPPGQAADAGCDLAWLRLRTGDRDGAHAAVVSALQVCPDHIEAQRWQLALIRWQPADDCLRPRREHGWLSPERIRRRPHGHDIAPQTSALGRLRAAGVWLRRIATDAEYDQMDADDPRVSLELAVAGCWAVLRSQRPPAAALAAVWWQALQLSDRRSRLRGARAVVEIALRCPAGDPTGIAAAEVLAIAQPEVPRWQAALARMRAASGDASSIRGARAVLRRPALDAESWRLAIAALQLCGLHTEATAHAESALDEPDLERLAFGVLSVV